MPKILNAEVISNAGIIGNTMKMILLAPEIAVSCVPGQFVNVHTVAAGLSDPLLKRPISICDASPKDGTITLVYSIVGRGTELLGRINDFCEVVGPLGRGFEIMGTEYTHILIGGGVGAAPLYFLDKKIKESGCNTQVITGYGTKEQIFSHELFPNAIVATDDGTYGEKGFATVPFERYLKDNPRNSYAVYVCGPTPMMKAVCSLAAKFSSVKTVQVSLENVMACGIGVCTGCVCKVKSPDGYEYKRVCKDGPVFGGYDIIW